MRIEIPMLPPKEANPNWKGHWARKMRAVNEFRRAAFYSAHFGLGAHRRGYEKAEVEVRFIIPSRRHIKDPDNALASLKAAIDGCVAAGVIPDDDDEHLSYRLPIMYEINKGKTPMTILEFKEMPR